MKKRKVNRTFGSMHSRRTANCLDLRVGDIPNERENLQETLYKSPTKGVKDSARINCTENCGKNGKYVICYSIYYEECKFSSHGSAGEHGDVMVSPAKSQIPSNLLRVQNLGSEPSDTQSQLPKTHKTENET